MSDLAKVAEKAVMFDLRQLAEMRFALYYADHCRHGTSDHNRLMLLAQCGKALGFSLGEDQLTLLYDESVHMRVITSVPAP